MVSAKGPTEDDNIRIPDELFDFHLCDARKMLDRVKEHTNFTNFINVTITSPPYHDILSYDYVENQIGYGQEYELYLRDLGIVFKQLYDLTLKEGSLWVIIDTFTKHNIMILLPHDLINVIQDQGWYLKDIIIWKKDKTRPWVKKGKMRKIFEYILFFVKSERFDYYVDRIREINTDYFKEWWVKYPERYNPKGIVPTNIWEFSIPVQGIWGSQNLKHSNPLPVKMIERIIKLTTNENDVVCDPFSGSGIVLAVATVLNRKYLGFDLNKNYINNYPKVVNYVKDLYDSYDESDINELQNLLSNKIINLRIVKFGKTLIKELVKSSLININYIRNLNSIFILKSNHPSSDITDQNIKVANVDVYVIFHNNPPKLDEDQIDVLLSRRELTRYQINSKIYFLSNESLYEESFNKRVSVPLYLYSNAITYKYEKIMTINDWKKENVNSNWLYYFYDYVPPILSNVDVSEKLPRTWKTKKEKNELKRMKLIDLLQ